MNENDFIKAIVGDLRGDKEIRLAYADWLEENGVRPALIPVLRTENAAVNSVGGVMICGPLAVEQRFGVCYTDEQLASLRRIPFSRDVLRHYFEKDFYLVAGYPLTLLELAEHDCRLHIPESCRRWRCVQKRRVRCRWHLIQVYIPDESLSKDLDTQLELLTEQEEASVGCEFLFASLLYRFMHGFDLLDDESVRCRDSFNGETERLVIHSYDDSLEVDLDENEHSSDSLGMAISVKPGTVS